MTFLIAAYAALWIGLFAYLFWLAAKVRALRAEARTLANRADAGSHEERA